MLTGRVDMYNGIIINVDSLPDTDEEFQEILKGKLRIPKSILTRLRSLASLALWTEQGKRGVWLSVPLSKASFIPIAAKVTPSIKLASRPPHTARNDA